MLLLNFIKVLIVDDGSTDHTSKVAFEFVRKHKIDNVRVLLLGRNHGKGEAVRKVSKCTSRSPPPPTPLTSSINTSTLTQTSSMK